MNLYIPTQNAKEISTGCRCLGYKDWSKRAHDFISHDTSRKAGPSPINVVKPLCTGPGCRDYGAAKHSAGLGRGELDTGIVKWLQQNQFASPEAFEKMLVERYANIDLL